ncbi:MAG: T9SS type A sorting domain-containing protein, partial [Bacteroidales bacterium]|nr:T9SS type A sorting domain-containing protein [Bacteroidales bacterium]
FEGFQYTETYFDFTGLIYDGIYDHDMGYGVKKLSYYTYKLLVEKLEGSDWDSITTIIDSIDNKYAYKFINDSTGNPTYVAWWDYFNDPTYNQGDSNLITLSEISANQVIITNTIPTDTSGIDITDYNTAFSIDTISISGGSVSFYLKESPVYVEELNSTSIANEVDFKQNINIYPNPMDGVFTIQGENIQLIEVLNINGQTIKQLSIDNKLFTIDLSNQPKGIYLIKIVIDKGIINKKIVLE